MAEISPELKHDIRETLKMILEFVGADLEEYVDSAQLLTWIENLHKRH